MALHPGASLAGGQLLSETGSVRSGEPSQLSRESSRRSEPVNHPLYKKKKKNNENMQSDDDSSRVI